MQWKHSIPQELVNGILIGYRVEWDEDRFSSDHPDNSQGYAEVGLDSSNYVVTSLHEYWLYNIRVAGRTSVGHGIYTSVTARTDESSKCCTDLFFLNFSHSYPFFRDYQMFKSRSFGKTCRKLRIPT